MDLFLRQNPRPTRERGIAHTYVATEADDPVIVGFYTLSNISILASGLSATERRQLSRHRIPMVRLERLAVDRSARGLGLGDALLYDALKRSAEAAASFGFEGMQVHARDDAAAGFLGRHGFTRLDDDRPRDLYLPFGTVRQTFDAP